MTDTTQRNPWPRADLGSSATLAPTGPPVALPDGDGAVPPGGPASPVGPTGGDGRSGRVRPEARGNPLRLVVMVATLAAVGLFAGWSWLVIIGALIVSIFLHEAGHFLVAKWAGMKVTEYFIGFGPRIWSFKRGETEYGIKVISAGAYVRILGMSNLEEVDPADEDRTYRSKPYLKRLPVILAGPFANFAIALVLLFVLFAGFGVSQPDQWSVGTVVPGSSAEAAGLQTGDRIVSFDGQTPGDWEGFTDLIQPTAGQPVDVVIERDGVEQTIQATLGWRLSAEAAAALAPMREGDQIVSLDGEPVATYGDLARTLADAPPGTAALVFDNNGTDYSVDLPVPLQLPADGYTGFFGVGHQSAPGERMDPISAAGQSFTQFGSIMADSARGIGNLFSPSGLSRYWDTLAASTESTPVPSTDVPVAVPVDAAGPTLTTPAQAPDPNRPMSIIGIVQVGSAAAEAGPIFLLEILIVVNAFLGLINLVPLPPLDGGHAAIATYEAIRGRIRGRAYRVDMAKLMPVVYAAFAFLTLFGLSAMYLDLADPLQYGG